MNIEDLLAINKIDESWGLDGFLGKLKEGIFDQDKYNELKAALSKLDFDNDQHIDRDIIRILWFIPIFMYRFKEHVADCPPNYDAMREDIEECLANIFGYP